jgi:transcriptional regulator with XRE-family HTH domain
VTPAEGRERSRFGDESSSVPFGAGSVGSDVYNSFSGNLRFVRRDRGLTLEEVAEMCELSPNYVGNLERGERKPSLKTVHRIAKCLNVDAGRLLRRGGHSPSSPAPSDKLHRQIAALVSNLTLRQKAKVVRFIREFLLR